MPLALLIVSCDLGDAMRGLRDAPATAHERYGRALTDAGLDRAVLGRDWLRASDSALRAPLDVSLPFQEASYYSRAEARSVAYRISLREGQRLAATVQSRGLPVQLFVDLFEPTADTAKPFEHRATADTSMSDATDERAATFSLSYEVPRTGPYLLRIQPELLRSGRYDVTLRVEPSLAFPVEGVSNGAVQSFYGADRDAGRRLHQGIDIFAPRGTPVLAATDGVVRSISPNQLGGKVVWLSDARRGQTLYYAHLDSQVVTEGQRVRLGDTLGFVGNTGNARTTRPHLHFGIYRRGSGAVDPYPYVQRVTSSFPGVDVDTGALGRFGRTTIAAAALLDSPSARGDTLRRIGRDTPLQIVGAAGRWFRVQLPDGSAGYLVARATSVVDRSMDGNADRRAAMAAPATLDAFGFPAPRASR